MEANQLSDLAEINELTEKIIRCAFAVSNTLGVGFVEKVYENALVIELRNNGIACIQQAPIKVRYQNAIVGEFAIDIWVENIVLVELKSVKSLDDQHFAQCINYLKASGNKVCLLINFGTKRIQVKRIIK
jgi:GxxExxY protein